MTPRPTFTLRELRRLADALHHCAHFHHTKSRILDDKGTKQAAAQAARDAAAFARLRVKVNKLIDGRGKAGGGR
jgi:hypothetical protein